MPEKEEDQFLIDQVSRPAKYTQLAGTLVSRVTIEEAKKHRRKQDIIQSARTRLHQLTGAYLAPKIDYTQWLHNFKSLNPDDELGLKATSLSMMRLHASTYERIEVLPTFFPDLACFHQSGQIRFGSRLRLESPFHPLDAPRGWLHLLCQ